MDPALLLSFVIAATVLIVVPGPNVAFIVATAVTHGFRGALAAVAGTMTAMATQLAVVTFGLMSAALLLSEWFEVIRWVGVAYLIYLGIQTWLTTPPEEGATQGTAERKRNIFWRGFLVAAVNPKTLFFFGAFLPQFVSTGAHVTAQLTLLSLIFLVIALVIDTAYALLASKVSAAAFGRSRDRISGALLIIAGVGLAAARRG